ncbi:hypothetical protein KY285_007359 [Solanum tuberosum]|nr:hypothetical protein KY285_007359 [Solanum tuberosum]
MSTTDIKVFGTLDLKVLPIDENGRRKTQEPTMFYMPSPSYFLIGNLLEANWSSSSLEQIFLLTNSLDAIEYALPSYDQFALGIKTRLAIAHVFKTEIPILESSDCQMYASLFPEFGWHFFKGVKDLPECIWLYRQRYLEMAFEDDFKSKKISKEFEKTWLLYVTLSNFEVDVIAGLASLKHGLKKCKRKNLKIPRLIVESDDIMLVHYVNGYLVPNETVKKLINALGAGALNI